MTRRPPRSTRTCTHFPSTTRYRSNLTNREADCALRVVYDRKTLPLNLHGLKGPELFGGVYISRDRLAAWRAGTPDPLRWIVISMHGIPDWANEGEVRIPGVPFRVTDGAAEIAAVRQGLGIPTLPCFVGNADPLLVRLPGTDLHMYGTDRRSAVEGKGG